MWVGAEHINTPEILAKYFIRFEDMEEGCVVYKTRLSHNENNLKTIKMSNEIIQWCHDGSMGYRKIATYDLVTVDVDGFAQKYGEQLGLLFYSIENAMAFKLRWC